MIIKKYLIWLAWMMVILLTTSGCVAKVALMPETLDVEAKRFSPPLAKAHIYVTRTSKAVLGVLFQVHLDGQMAGSIAPNTYFLFEVDPGNHQIAVFTQENLETIMLSVGPGTNYFVDVVPKWGWAVAQAALKELTPEEGRKAVQHAKRAEPLLR